MLQVVEMTEDQLLAEMDKQEPAFQVSMLLTCVCDAMWSHPSTFRPAGVLQAVPARRQAGVSTSRPGAAAAVPPARVSTAVKLEGRPPQHVGLSLGWLQLCRAGQLSLL